MIKPQRLFGIGVNRLALELGGAAALLFSITNCTGRGLLAPSGVILGWKASSSADVVGYNVYYGQATGAYTNPVSVANVTNATITGLAGGITYFFAVTAIDSQGLESDFSSEISFTLPTTNPAPSVTLATPVDGASSNYSCARPDMK